jgi:predicted nucleotidyltransferase
VSLDEISRIVRSWAAGQTGIAELWLFGSRVKGDNRPDSDIDIAIKYCGTDWGWRFSTYLNYQEKWSKELNDLLRMQVHIQILEPFNTDYIITWSAVDEYGVLIFGDAIELNNNFVDC